MRLRVLVILFAALAVVLGSAQTAVAASRHSQGASPRVPQVTVRPGDPGYNLIPASQAFKGPIPRAPKTPYFRGGAHSKTTVPATSTPRRIPAATASPKIQLFNSINLTSLTSQINGSTGTPPDSTGSIGPTAYVEIVNSAIAVWDRTNLSQTAVSSLASFLNAPGLALCDPQVQWDAAANRWIFSILYCNINDTTQGFFLGWSKTSDPSNLLANNTVSGPGTGGWCGYVFLTGHNLFDYQKLGHNSGYMIIGGNYYSENPAGNPNPPFVTSQIIWFQLPGLGDTSCSLAGLSYNYTAQNPLKNGDGVTKTFTPVPVNTFSAATDGYVFSSYDAGGNVQAP
ncbi:MAG TPA: hypothetical protein VG013_14045, partial [Gemmataceae bacterium]|nr:hypothetical protein [Gemmataceae bacterium]